ncbi:MAG: hypothetical protein IH628_03250, partial [Proteobacteria bacterium]|nr:hypothetical protein [Pseudomonadota bacterium]
MSVKSVLRPAVPVVYLAALLFAFPLFDGWYTEIVSFVRVSAGKIAVSAGIVKQAEGLMFGMFKPELPYSFDETTKLEIAIGKKLDIVSFYTTWGEREEDRFPLTLMQEVDKHGSIALLTWEPWTTEFAVNAGRSSDALRTDLGEIAAGRYDAYIREWAREAVI